MTIVSMIIAEAELRQVCRQPLLGDPICFLFGRLRRRHGRQLVNQLLIWGNFMVAAEGLIIGAKAGLDVGALVPAIAVSGGSSRTFEHRFPRMVLRGEFRPGAPTDVGTLDLAAKDVYLAVESARQLGASSPIAVVVDDMIKRAQAHGWGQHASHSGVQVLEQMAGVELRAS